MEWRGRSRQLRNGGLKSVGDSHLSSFLIPSSAKTEQTRRGVVRVRVRRTGVRKKRGWNQGRGGVGADEGDREGGRGVNGAPVVRLVAGEADQSQCGFHLFCTRVSLSPLTIFFFSVGETSLALPSLNYTLAVFCI